MKDLSLHIMDIAQNSIVAGAQKISISLCVQGDPQMLILEIIDDGKGMDEEFLRKVMDPFKTSRTTRNVGLGIPLLMQSAQMAGGELEINSEPGKGTKLQAKFIVNNIDRIPLGDIPETIKMLIMANPNISWTIYFSSQNDDYTLETDELKHHLDGVSIENSSVLEWIQNTVADGIKSVYGGVLDEVD